MRRVPELDAVRGLAALTILLYHLRPGKLFFGWAAVDFFFVLSGYLITTILLQHRPSLGFLAAFYVRRGLRIWPIYYLAILAVVLVNPWLPRPYELAGGLPWYLTYTQNLPHYWFGDTHAVLPLGHTWSLAVEEQFYLLWPALVCLVGRRGLVPLALGWIALAVAGRGLSFHLHLLLTRCDGLALGGLLAVLLLEVERVQRHLTQFTTAFTTVALGALAYLIGGVLLVGKYPFLGAPDREDVPLWAAPTLLVFNLLFAGIAGLLICHSGHRRLGWLRHRWLVYLGQISYGLYLYHWVLFRLANQLSDEWGLGRPYWLELAKVAASFLVAALSWRFIEQPLLALKDLAPYPRAVPPDTPAPAVLGEAPGHTPGARRRSLELVPAASPGGCSP